MLGLVTADVCKHVSYKQFIFTCLKYMVVTGTHLHCALFTSYVEGCESVLCWFAGTGKLHYFQQRLVTVRVICIPLLLNLSICGVCL